MTTSSALVPSWLDRGNDKKTHRMFVVTASVVFLSLLAQVSLPLPFTPVPLTGQTLGILLMSLALGRKLGMSSALAYMSLGAVGFPIFAEGLAGLGRPTTGYLFGMVAATWVVGGFADRGFARSFGKAVFAAILGEVIIFALGIAGLAVFIPSNLLLSSGLWPFIPGEMIKVLLAASMASTISGYLRTKVS